ncbi:hypothetical protein [Plantactinospora sp. GCM10030261]|uniref:hypothetical protein n=1 Tax=Plantactinospora sp. GCM10030261 TaxID=3273420 RepID=UPI003607B958
MSTQSQMNRATARMPDTERQMPDMPTRQMPSAHTHDMPAGRETRDGRMPARGTETKPSVLSSEFWVYLAAVGGVLLASYLVDTSPATGVDPFRANQAWWLITLLTIAYLGSRGLAKLASSWRHGSR